jgi:hypothetical protein
VSVEDELDTLYGVAPEEFTALRKDLANAAKKRGDTDAARAISAARRPTTAAWVVNCLVRADDTVRPRLGDLTGELRSAHAQMDGPRIRELSGVQRKLIGELVKAAFAAAEMPNPSAAVREDVTGTLQAAIADPEVAGRLGRLEKAEQFAGFGDFGTVSESAPRKSAPKTVPKKSAGKPAPPQGPTVSASERRAARHRRDAAVKAAASARKASAEAADALTEAKSRSATALRRYQKILESLSSAERELNSATAEVENAERAGSAADRAAHDAAADLAEAERALADLD